MEARKYPSIKNLFERNPDNPKQVIPGSFSLPVFQALRDIEWEATEKIDGTNIAVIWDGQSVRYRGRTEKAQIPGPLAEYLAATLTIRKLDEIFHEMPAILYGEGVGPKIQGGKAGFDEPTFVLFDMLINDHWQERMDVEAAAANLGVYMAPILDLYRLDDIVYEVMQGFESRLNPIQAEGVVIRPPVELQDRLGNRIIAKIKTRDFQ